MLSELAKVNEGLKVSYEGQAHGFFNKRNGKTEYYDKTVAAADAFLRSLKLLPEKN